MSGGSTLLEQSHSQYIDDHDSFDGINSFDSEILGVCKNARLTTSFDTFSRERKSVIDDDEWHIAQMFNKYVKITCVFLRAYYELNVS